MSDTTTEIAAAERRRYASRKFLLACSVIVAAHAALWQGKIAPAQWVDLLVWISGLYFGANVGAVAVDLLKGRAT